MNTGADHQQRRGHEPNHATALVRAAALVMVGAACHGVGELCGRLLGWVTVHVCQAEERWVTRATHCNQRAYRALRPWRESVHRFAHWHARQSDQHRGEAEVIDPTA